MTRTRKTKIQMTVILNLACLMQWTSLQLKWKNLRF